MISKPDVLLSERHQEASELVFQSLKPLSRPELVWRGERCIAVRLLVKGVFTPGATFQSGLGEALRAGDDFKMAADRHVR